MYLPDSKKMENFNQNHDKKPEILIFKSHK